MSLATYEKPMEHVPLEQYKARLTDLQRLADTERNNSYMLRHQSRQNRTDANLDKKWTTYHNNVRLNDRLTEVTRWREVLESCLKAVQKEIGRLKVEKSITDQAVETVINTPLSVVSECITLRDGRHGNDLNQDEAYDELNNERDVVEALKRLLSEKCQEGWEQLNRLGEEEFKLQLDLANKDIGIEIENYNLEIDKNCAGASYKPDPLRIPNNCIPYEEWLETSQANKARSDKEISRAIKLREEMYASRERALNALQKQHDATNFALRRRVYETQRAKNEFEWQKLKMGEEMDKVQDEITVLEESLREKTDGLKLAETRLENRMFRCGPELVQDAAQDGLAEEVKILRKMQADLLNNIFAAKTQYNALENLMAERIEGDLENKYHSLMTDLRVIDTRKRLLAEDRTPTSKKEVNFELTRVIDEIPMNDR